MSDPLEDSGLNETLQEIIQENSNRYIILSTLIFQSEKFLKKEAKALGINYPFNRRSELIKELALEEYPYKTILSLENHWESHSERQRSKRLRDNQRVFKGEISRERYSIQLNRWAKEDAQLHRNDIPAYKVMPWLNFCIKVFTRYSKKLPAYEAYIKTLEVPKYGSIKKLAIINKVLKNYPGRGSSKRSKTN